MGWEWERAMHAQHELRDAARAPYLAPQRHPVSLTRVATRGRTQFEDIAAYLACSGFAGRPELVYGAARVPDRISPALGAEGGRVVEWDIVHAADGPLPAAAEPGDVYFEADRAWVDRAVGAPAPLDEDLALDVLVRAGVGPERTIGIARHVTIDPRSSDDGQPDRMLLARVRGVRILVPSGAEADALHAAAHGAPLRIAAGPPPGVHVEVLDWDAIAQAVQPVRLERPPMPSPRPHLPVTANELLRAYLEIVGVAPADSYGVQVTYDGAHDLLGRTSATRDVRENCGGEVLPCADGKQRSRVWGGHHVVIAYRDWPAYAAGRARWRAYQAEVLRTDLGRHLNLRPPVPEPGDRTSEPPRYCWAPA